MNRRNNIVISMIFILFLSIPGCSNSEEAVFNPPAAGTVPHAGQYGSFADYLRQVKSHIRKNRHFQGKQQIEIEVLANTPFELLPDEQRCHGKEREQKGVLLIHGLSDSPFSMKDIGQKMAESCFLVRTILLPGHGTRPGELLGVTAEDWIRTARFALETMKQEVTHVYLGGFSTGANLSVWLALNDPAVRGLILFSPAFALKYEYSGMIRFLDLFMDWLAQWPEDDYARYNSFSINALKQFYVTSDLLKQGFEEGRELKIPVFMALSMDDSVVNVEYVRRIFQQRFKSPSNRLMVFAKNPISEYDSLDKRVIYRKSNLKENQIVSFSHMAIPFAPHNPHYGKSGDYRNCLISNDKDQMNNCRSAPQDKLWYGPYGVEREEGKSYARLTYNPYFDEMTNMMRQTLKHD